MSIPLGVISYLLDGLEDFSINELADVLLGDCLEQCLQEPGLDALETIRVLCEASHYRWERAIHEGEAMAADLRTQYAERYGEEAPHGR